jgi:hypothetical protein
LLFRPLEQVRRFLQQIRQLPFQFLAVIFHTRAPSPDLLKLKYHALTVAPQEKQELLPSRDPHLPFSRALKKSLIRQKTQAKTPTPQRRISSLQAS